MAKTDLIVYGVLFLFKIRLSFEDCVEPSAGQQKYWCRTVKDLEVNGNELLLDVDIHDGTTRPVISNQTHHRTPSLQAVLTDDAAEGLSTATYTLLKNLMHQLSTKDQNRILRKGTFDNLPLRKLNLNGNGIASIHVGAFSNMRFLKELSITHNNLRSVEVGIFNSLVVRDLDLSNNKISIIRKNSLYNMRNLKNLNLAGNSLSEFLPDTFINFGSKLETLSLQRNYFTEFDRRSVKSLDNLRILNLANNRITNLEIYSLENLLKLEELILSSNQLQELRADVFSVDGMPTLSKLQINNNRLSCLTVQLLGRLDGLKYFRLGGNPWLCSCYDAILKWLDDHRIYQFCDFIYHTGTVPVCLAKPDTSGSINKFAEAVDSIPVEEECSR